MQNKPIYLWPFIIVYRITMMIIKFPLAIVHYFIIGLFFAVYTTAKTFVYLGMIVSFVWWKFLKYFFMGLIFPFAFIIKQFSGTKKSKPLLEKKAINNSVNVSNDLEIVEKTDKEITKLNKINEKEKLKHQKMMDKLKAKEKIKEAKEKIKNDKLLKIQEAKEKKLAKLEALKELKEQQRLIKEEKSKQKVSGSNTINEAKKEKVVKEKSFAQIKKEEAKQAKIKLKEEKKKRKEELIAEKKKLKEKNTYVNEKVVIEKKKFGDVINDFLEKLIQVPKKIVKKLKNDIFNSAIARDKRNLDDIHREALLIDFDSADATKSAKKLVYEYVGKSSEGKLVKSYFEAFSKVEVHSFLLSEGFEVYSIKTNGLIQFLHGSSTSNNCKFKTKDLIFFLTQLSTYIKAGIPLVEALRILSRQFQQKGYQKVFRSMIYELTMGDNFSVALEKQGTSFPKLLVNMVKTSEMTGELPETLDDMQIYFEEAEKTKKQMITALTYPTIVFVLAVAAITFIMVYIVPQFAGIYEDMDNAELPGITVAIMSVSNFLKGYWMFVIAGIVVTVVLISYLYKNVKLFRTLMQWFMMKLPIIGDVIVFNEVTMFTKTFASLLKHNVFITDTMEILNKTTNNEIWKMIILDTITNLAKGEKISLAFQDHWAVPIPAYEMIVTGERTGQLPEMMQKVSDYYQELHKNAVGRIKAFIEPILILFLTGAVGVIVLSIVIPMFDMYQQLN